MGAKFASVALAVREFQSAVSLDSCGELRLILQRRKALAEPTGFQFSTRNFSYD
jgi:hypothetical protein